MAKTSSVRFPTSERQRRYKPGFSWSTNLKMTGLLLRQSTDLVAIEDLDIARAVRFIRELACQRIDVSRVAEEVGMFRRDLDREFLHYVGRAPIAEMRRKRI
jgi:LacI family transcriptional regulator